MTRIIPSHALLDYPFRKGVWTGVHSDHGMVSPRAWTSESKRRGPGLAIELVHISKGDRRCNRLGDPEPSGRTNPETRRRSSEARRCHTGSDGRPHGTSITSSTPSLNGAFTPFYRHRLPANGCEFECVTRI